MRLAFAFGALLLLSACGEDAAPAEAEGESEAAGEVLEGTISDAMLPIDQTRSQAPLAAPEPGEEGEGGGAASSGSAEGDTAAPVEAAQPVSEEPATEPPAE